MEQMHAKWQDTYNDGDMHCTNCGAIVEKDEQLNHNWYYCYHCGAKMENPFMFHRNRNCPNCGAKMEKE